MKSTQIMNETYTHSDLVTMDEEFSTDVEDRRWKRFTNMGFEAYKSWVLDQEVKLVQKRAS